LERRLDSGSTNVSFHVRDMDRLLQGAQGGFNLTY
jgi:hypothetical protein